jgi:hypothetical protein
MWYSYHALAHDFYVTGTATAVQLMVAVRMVTAPSRIREMVVSHWDQSE